MNDNKSNLYHNKNFILLFLGGLVSRIGNGIHNIAILWFVLDLTGSATATGTLLVLTSLPGVILGPFSGVIADRVNRKFLIVGMDVIRGLVVLGLSWFVSTGTAGFLHLGVATVLVSICNSFFNPAVSATLPNIVDDSNLQQANSMEHISMNLTQIIGAAVGGILIATFGIAGVFMLNGISYLISAFSELFIKIPPIKKVEKEDGQQEKTSFIEDIKFGFNFLYGHRSIFYLFVMAVFLNFLTNGLFGVGIPYIFKEVLEVSSSQFGYAQSLFFAGAIIGALLLNFLPEIKNYYMTIFGGMTVESLLIICVGIPTLPFILHTQTTTTIYIWLITTLVSMGIINAIINVPFQILFQRLIPDNIRGRVFGLLGTFTMALSPVSMGLTGFLLDRVLPGYIFIISGSLTLILVLATSRVKVMKTIGQSAPEETQPLATETQVTP